MVDKIQIIAILNNVDNMTDKSHKEIVKLVLESFINGYTELGGNTSEEQFLIDELMYYKNNIN